MACLLVGACGGDEPPLDGYEVSEPSVIFHHGYSPVAETHVRILALNLSWPRVTYTEYAEDDLEEPAEFWFSNVDEATERDGKALLSPELVAIYEEDSVPLGAGGTPYARLLIILPPTTTNDRVVRLREENARSPETEALLAYLFGVYDAYAPAAE